MHTLMAKLNEDILSDGSSVFSVVIYNLVDGEPVTSFDVVDEADGENLVEYLMRHAMNVNN